MPEVPSIRRPRQIARGIGRGLRTTGGGIYETGAGFIKSLGVPRPTARGVGKATGGVFRGIGEAFKDSDYFWGDWETPRQETRPREPRRPTSRLPIETQSIMIRTLAEFYPEIYARLWYRGVEYSAFIGSLRVTFPDVYEEMRDYAYTPTPYTHRPAPYTQRRTEPPYQPPSEPPYRPLYYEEEEEY